MKRRITFFGEDGWSAHLASGLAERFGTDAEFHAATIDHRGGVLDALKHLLRDDIIVRVGFPPPYLPDYQAEEHSGSRSPREYLKRAAFRTGIGRALRRTILFARLVGPGRRRFLIDWLQRATRIFRSARKDVIYWIGTDVLIALDALQTLRKPDHYLRRVHAFAGITGAHRLTLELAGAGIEADTVPYPPRAQAPASTSPLPQRLTVLTYVPDSRREFYGLPAILEVAGRLPDIRFIVMGGDGADLVDIPRNISFVGWVEDPDKLYRNSSVVVRHVEHDGAGYSMAEALMYGRHVVYTYDSPHTILVRYGDVDALEGALSALLRLHSAGDLRPNDEGRAWALQEFDANHRFEVLHRAIMSQLDARPGT